MAKKECAHELDQKLSLLSQAFSRELKKIAEQRLKLEKETIISIKADVSVKRATEREMRLPVKKSPTVRLESSLCEKLAKSRGTADELEDKLQETRTAYEDKLRTVDRMKMELDRRESILVNSIQEIESYLRAVFYLKQDASSLHTDLEKTSTAQAKILEELESKCGTIRARKEFVLKTIRSFRPVKLSLEKVISDLPHCFATRDVVEHYLVLKAFQNDLLDKEKEVVEGQQALAVDRQCLEERRRLLPTIVVSKENKILELKSKLRGLKYEIAQLGEQIGLGVIAKVKEDSFWHDVQKWIKKIFSASVEIRQPAPDKMTSRTIDMLDLIGDFVSDGLEIMQRLKSKRGGRVPE